MRGECGLATVELVSGLLTRLGYLDAPGELANAALMEAGEAWWRDRGSLGGWERFWTDFRLWEAEDERYAYVCPLEAWNRLKAQGAAAGGPILLERPPGAQPPPPAELQPGIPPVAIVPLGPPYRQANTWLWTVGLGLGMLGVGIWIARKH